MADSRPPGQTHGIPNMRHLQLLLEVIRTGNISQVAQAVHLTQPAVTQAIGTVEAALGGGLFERTANLLRATEVAHIWGRRITRALQMLRDAVESARDRDTSFGSIDTLRGISVAQLTALIAVVEHG